MARRKIDRFIDSCPIITEEYKQQLKEEYSDEKRLDDVVAVWIYEKIKEDVDRWYGEAADKWVPYS